MTLVLIIVGVLLVAFITFSVVRGLIKLAVLAAVVLVAFFIAHRAGAF